MDPITATIAAIIEFLQAIKKVLDVVNYIKAIDSLDDGGLEKIIGGYIRSMIWGEIVDVGSKNQLPPSYEGFDKLIGNFQEAATNIIGSLSPASFNRFLDLDQPVPDYIDALKSLTPLELSIAALVELQNGQRIGNGKSQQGNLAKSGDPILLFSGEFEHRVDDFIVQGAGIDFVFRRVYRSGASYQGPLGANWDHSYNMRLRKEDGGDIIVLLNGDLSEVRFVKHPKHSIDGFTYYVPPNGIHDVIVEDCKVQGSYILKSLQGLNYRFSKSDERSDNNPSEYYKLEKIEDRFTNYLQFKYDNDQIKFVYVNSTKRYVKFEYDTSNRRIINLTDHTTRSLAYEYDDWGYLIKVVGPVNATSFDGEIIRREFYEYDFVGNARKLIRVFDFNGRIKLENEYDRNQMSFSFGRVVRQQVNRGEYYFYYQPMYHDVDFITPDKDLPYLRILETKRNGHQVEHLLNKFGNELMTSDRFVDGGRITERKSFYRYNDDGNIVLELNPEGVLTQYLFGRESTISKYFSEREQISGIENVISADHVFGSIDENNRMSFGNLLAEVTRWDGVNNSLGDYHQVIERLPDVNKICSTKDNIIKYTFHNITQLLLSASDPRYTKIDDLNQESNEHKIHLTKYNYENSHPYKLEEIIYPGRIYSDHPDDIPELSVSEKIIKYDLNGKILERIDINGYLWISEYYEEDSCKDGFLKRKLIPHVDWRINEKTPNILGIQIPPKWDKLANCTKGIIGDLIIKIEGVRLTICQTCDGSGHLGRNSSVKVTVGDRCKEWDQTEEPQKVIDELQRGIHTVKISSTSKEEIYIGRIQSHVSIDYEMDDLGRIKVEMDPRGYSTRYDYDALGYKKLEIKSDGETQTKTEYFFDPSGNLIQQKEYWYKPNGNLRPQKAVIEIKEYDSENLLLAEKKTTETEEGSRSWQYHYDAEGNRRLSTNPRGVHTYFDYDELGRQIRTIRAGCSPDSSISITEYDLSDRVISRTNPRGFRTTYILDNFGRIVSQIDPLGNIVQRKFDKLGNLLVEQLFHFKKESYLLLSRVEMEYDEHGDQKQRKVAIFNNPILITNPNNVELVENEFNQHVQGGFVKYAVTNNYLDASGNKVCIKYPDDGVLRQWFDGQGRIFDELDAEKRRVFRIFDGNGNITRTYTYDPICDSEGNDEYEVFIQQYEYDAFNRLKATIDPYGNRWEQEYDSLGNLILTTDPLKNEISYEYNAFGEEVKKTEILTKTGLGGDEHSTDLETTHKYDANGNVTKIRDPAGKKIEYRYNAMDRLVETWFDIDEEPHEYREYDANGNLVKLTDRNGLIKEIKFDKLDRIAYVKLLPNGIINSKNGLSKHSATYSSFEYDAAGYQTLHENDYCKVEISRDSRGLPISETVIIKNISGINTLVSYAFDRRYDISGRREKLILQSGRVISYAFDKVGRVKKIEQTRGNISDETDQIDTLAEYTYAGNRLKKIVYGNGAESTLYYDV